VIVIVIVINSFWPGQCSRQ